MAKRGPPATKLDWEQVNAMCRILCTGEEISSILSIDYDTLNAACKRDHKMGFSDHYKKHSSGGKMSLRRAQMKNALEGNPTLQIWLGKQHLGQTDKVENTNNDKDINLNINLSK